MDIFSWIPEAEETLRRRFRLLDHVKRNGISGRRALGDALHVPERRLRSDVETLVSTHMVTVSRRGVSITDQGLRQLADFSGQFPELSRLIQLENELRQLTGCGKVLVKDNPIIPENALRLESLANVSEISGEERYRLRMKNALVLAGDLILNDQGKPLQRLKRPTVRRPVTLLGVRPVSADMIRAAILYYHPEMLLLDEASAEALLRLYTKKRGI